jgi:hypothetical protein
MVPGLQAVDAFGDCQGVYKNNNIEYLKICCVMREINQQLIEN